MSLEMTSPEMTADEMLISHEAMQTCWFSGWFRFEYI